MKKRIIVFSPHPDDETLGCGGTIAKRTREGYEVLIIILTDGRYSHLEMLGIDSNPTPEELKEIRKEEVKNAIRILGVPQRNLLFLDFVDGTLENNEKKACEQITEILSKNHPVEVYFPYKKDYHSDHRATYKIVKKSIKKLGVFPAMYQYSITRKYARVEPIIDLIYSFFSHTIVSVEITEFLSLKKAAIKEFKSELSTIYFKPKTFLSNGINKFLKNNEVFYVDK